MANVKNIYEKISEVVNSQVDQMFHVEENYAYAENKT